MLGVIFEVILVVESCNSRNIMNIMISHLILYNHVEGKILEFETILRKIVSKK